MEHSVIVVTNECIPFGAELTVSYGWEGSISEMEFCMCNAPSCKWIIQTNLASKLHKFLSNIQSVPMETNSNEITCEKRVQCIGMCSTMLTIEEQHLKLESWHSTCVILFNLYYLEHSSTHICQQYSSKPKDRICSHCASVVVSLQEGVSEYSIDTHGFVLVWLTELVRKNQLHPLFVPQPAKRFLRCEPLLKCIAKRNNAQINNHIRAKLQSIAAS